MAKKKSKGKKGTWNKQVSPWIGSNKVWLATLWGVIGGAAVTAALTSAGGQGLLRQMSTSAKALLPQTDPSAVLTRDISSKTATKQDTGLKGDTANKPSPAVAT
jgi:hypothetical protein